MTPEPGYTVCYRHPKKVAVKNCKLCGRPICMQCGQESGDPEFCLPCKQDTMLHGDRLLEEPRDRETAPQPEARQKPIEVGEVTVFDDGTVVQPGATPSPTTPPRITYEPEERDAGPAVPPLVLAEPAAYEVLLQEPPAAEPTEAREGEPAADADEAFESQIFTSDKSVMGKPPRTGVFSQMLYTARYGLAVAAVVSGAWLIIAWVTKQWTQISVFTLGLAVPWAVYNATTRKRYLGMRVWKEPPPVIFMSTVSFIIVMAFTLLMEYLARLLIFGTRFPLSDFSQRYFRTTDWVLVICGLILAGLVPFLLKFGSELSAPSLRRKPRIPEKTGEEAGEPSQDTFDEIDRESVDEREQRPGESEISDGQPDDRPALMPGEGFESPGGEGPENKYWA